MTTRRSSRSIRRLLAPVLCGLLGVGAVDALAQAGPDPVADAGCTRIANYDPSLFGPRSHQVGNRFLPLSPGTQRVFEGRSNATGSVLPHRVTFTVTALTKVVDGVRNAVVWDVDESDDELAETELAIFSQDRLGRVWNLGEYPEEYPEGIFRGAPSTWFAGVEDAEPGVHMPVGSLLGRPEYLQGSVPGIEFLDCAVVVEMGARTCVPAGCFDNVLITHERSPLDPAGGIQVKYHAPGVGIVQIGALNDPEAETLVLTEFNRLTPAQVREANREARILDQRGRQCDATYAQTLPLEGPGGGDFGPYLCGVPEPPPPPPAVVTGETGQAFIPPAPVASPAPTPTVSEPVRPASRQRRRNALRGRFYAWVDHPLLPLSSLQSTVHEGRRDGVSRRITSRVRPNRVRVAGVLTTAVDRTERVRGTVVARSTRYYAQDRNRRVVILGERTSRVSDGRVTGRAGRWIAGRGGARPGLLLPSAPRVGTTFRQTRVPQVSTSRARVTATGAGVTTPAGSFTKCVEIRTTGAPRRTSDATRTYCPDVGLVREQTTEGIVDLVALR